MDDIQTKYRYDFPAFVEDIIYENTNFKLADFHNELMNIVSNNIDNRYVTFMLPRGHLKTWLFSICHPIWRMVIEKNFEICQVSSSMEQSMKTIRMVQDIIDNTNALKFLIPKGREQRWNQHGMNTTNRNSYVVKPFNSTGRGTHVNLLIMDDILREGDITPEGIKDTFWNVYFPTIQNKKGQLNFIGTPQTPDDLLMEIQTKEKYKDWVRMKKAAVITDNKGNWIRPLWGDIYTLDRLNKIKEDMGGYAFSREYMCMPETIGTRPFPTENILDCCDDNLTFTLETKGQVYMGVDLAYSAGKHGDYSVYIVVDVINGTYEKIINRKDGTTEKKIINNPIIIRHMERYKGLNPKVQREKIKAIYEMYRPSRVMVDESQWGVSLIEDLRADYIPAIGVDFARKNRTSLIVDLRRSFDERRMVIPTSKEDATYNRTQFIITELSKMRLKETKFGTPTYQVTSGHDDCLKKGTLIKTIYGYKHIEDIKVGDMVFTHKGRYKPVEKCIEKPFDGDFYKFDFQCQIPIELSYNHPLYAVTKLKSRKKGRLSEKKKWIFPNEWKKEFRQISVIEKLGNNENIVLREEDFYINSKQAHTKLKKIKLDREFAKFLGLFLAEGCCHRVNNFCLYPMSFGLNIKENELREFVVNYLKNLGVNVRVYETEHNCYSIAFSSKFLHYVLSECYDKNRNKQLPCYAKYLGSDLKYTLDYWLKGDGWFCKRKNRMDCYIGASISKSLALSMRDIAFSIRKYAVIRKLKRHRYGIPTKDQYWVEVYETRPRTGNLKKLSDFEYGSRIKGIKTIPQIKKENYTGIVYNLQVADDRSFVADGIVVHNCVMSLGLAIKNAFAMRKMPSKFIYSAEEKSLKR